MSHQAIRGQVLSGVRRRARERKDRDRQEADERRVQKYRDEIEAQEQSMKIEFTDHEKCQILAICNLHANTPFTKDELLATLDQNSDAGISVARALIEMTLP